MGNLENHINSIVTQELEEKTLEDFLEEHDLTPQEVVEHLFKSGLIRLEELESEEDS